MISENFPNIPNYHIDCKLGKGGMAVVYKGQHANLDRPVAIKLLRPDIIGNPHAIERFLKEPKILARFNHPNIVKIYDSGYVDPDHELLYIAMQYLPGGSLKAKMRHSRLALSRIIEIIKLIADALTVAHDKGIIHRDIKPENILFQENGEPVLTDFGIAKDLTSFTNPTALGALLGTYQYMSPEQFQGQGLDKRSDLYSLGIVLVELLTGQRPYDGDDIETILTRRLTEPVPTLPKALSTFQFVVDRLLAKDPNQRFANTSELIKALEAVELELGYSDKKFSLISANTYSSGRRIIQHWLIPQLDTSNNTFFRQALHGARPPRSWIFTGIATMVVASIAFFAAPVVHTALQMDSSYRVIDQQTINIEQQTGLLPARENSIQDLQDKIKTIARETTALEAEYEKLSQKLQSKQSELKQLQTQLQAQQQIEQKPNQSVQPIDLLIADQRRIEQLLVQAENAFANNAFTTPKDDNAIKWAEQVLVLDADNHQAQAIISRVIDAYLALARANHLGKKRKWLNRSHTLANYFSAQQRDLFTQLKSKPQRVNRTSLKSFFSSSNFSSGNTLLGSMEGYKAR